MIRINKKSKGKNSQKNVKNIVQNALNNKMNKNLVAITKPLLKKALMNSAVRAGASLGGSKGRQSGSFIGEKLSKLYGSGDYITSDSTITNSLFPKSKRNNSNVLSSFGGTGKDGVRMKHREYIVDLFAGANNTFTLQSFAINPGLSATFPFLSAIASNFEEYHVHGLVFEFVSTTSQYAAVSSLGSVIMAAQYDAFNTAYSNKQQMENSDYSISSNPTKSMMYGFECAVQNNPFYYVRSSTTTQPINLTDVGTFYVAVQNTTAFPLGSSLGELWISYDIEFRRPRILSSVANYSYLHLSYAQTTAGISAFTPRINDGLSTQVVKSYGLFANATWSATALTLSLPSFAVGDVICVNMNVTLSASSTLSVGTPAFALTGLSAYPVLVDLNGNFSTDSFRSLGIAAGGSTSQSVAYYKFTNIATAPTIAITFTTLSTSAKYNFDFIVTYIGNTTTFS